MHVREWGRRDDVPLFFWHARRPEASGADVEPLTPALTAAGFHVLGVDAPGFGRSRALQPDAYRLDALVELLHGLIDDRDLERPVLMGSSWGAAVAVSYAGTYPDDVRGLVLLASGDVDDRSDAWRVIARSEIPTLVLPHADIRRADAAVPPLGEEIAGWLVDQGL